MAREMLLSVLLGGLLAGCVAGPDHVRPDSATAPAFVRAPTDAQPAAPASRWWEGLGDPQLDALVARALADAPAIDAAEARVRQARAGVSSARAGLLPALSASATYIYADLPNGALGGSMGNIDLTNVGFDAQWEADLWGGKRRGIERAAADAGAAEAALADLHVTLSAEVARSYVALRARQASLALLDERARQEARLVAVMELRLSGGSGTRQELVQASQQRTRTGAEQAAMAAEITVLRDALATLTGQQPGALDGLAPAAVPLPPGEVRIGDPAALLQRRPDVMAAERRLASATAGIGVARGNRFPKLSLLGLVGIGGTSVGDVFDTSQITAAALPRLTWNFLDFGRAAAAVDAAEAGRDAALADYRASVLAALRDAEAALARFGGARIAFARATDAARQGGEIARLQELRARGGTAAPAEAIQARIGAINARLGEANDRASLTLAWVTLAKALGLGWQAPTSEPAQ